MDKPRSSIRFDGNLKIAQYRLARMLLASTRETWLGGCDIEVKSGIDLVGGVPQDFSIKIVTPVCMFQVVTENLRWNGMLKETTVYLYLEPLNCRIVLIEHCNSLDDWPVMAATLLRQFMNGDKRAWWTQNVASRATLQSLADLDSRCLLARQQQYPRLDSTVIDWSPNTGWGQNPTVIVTDPVLDDDLFEYGTLFADKFFASWLNDKAFRPWLTLEVNRNRYNDGRERRLPGLTAVLKWPYFTITIPRWPEGCAILSSERKENPSSTFDKTAELDGPDGWLTAVTRLLSYEGIDSLFLSEAKRNLETTTALLAAVREKQ